MKQQIDRNRIRADILAKKPGRKIREAIENNAFSIVEDICIDDLHNHGDSRWLYFKLSGKILVTKHNLLMPLTEKMFGVERYLSTKSWLNKKMYLVFAGDKNECVGVYVCDECFIPDVQLFKKAFPDNINKTAPRGIISLQLLSTLTIPKQNKPDGNKYSIHRHICTRKNYSYDGESSSTDFTIYLTNGDENITFRFSDNGKSGVIESSGVNCSNGDKAFLNVFVNSFYYVAFVNDKPRYLFSADQWKLSTEFNLLPKPQPKPVERQAYLQEIKPMIDRGVIREIYGNDTVSVLNLANTFYGITDYRRDSKETTQFVCAFGDYKLVKMLFNHPKELPLIMSAIRKVRFQSKFYDELITLSYHTQEVGPDDRIDLQMEEDIKNLFQEDIYASLEAPSFSKNDWMSRWG